MRMSVKFVKNDDRYWGREMNKETFNCCHD